MDDAMAIMLAIVAEKPSGKFTPPVPGSGQNLPGHLEAG